MPFENLKSPKNVHLYLTRVDHEEYLVVSLFGPHLLESVRELDIRYLLRVLSNNQKFNLGLHLISSLFYNRYLAGYPV